MIYIKALLIVAITAVIVVSGVEGSGCPATTNPPTITQVAWIGSDDTKTNQTRWFLCNNKDGFPDDDDSLYSYAGMKSALRPNVVGAADFDNNELHVFNANTIPKVVDGKQARYLYWNVFSTKDGKEKSSDVDLRYAGYVPKFTFMRKGEVWAVFLLATNEAGAPSYILIAPMDENSVWRLSDAIVFRDEGHCTDLKSADYSTANDLLFLSTCPKLSVKVLEINAHRYYKLNAASACVGDAEPSVLAMRYDPLCGFVYTLYDCVGPRTLKYRLIQYNPANGAQSQILEGDPPDGVTQVDGQGLFNRTFGVWYMENEAKTIGYANLDAAPVRTATVQVDFLFMGDFGYHYEDGEEPKITVSPSLNFQVNQTFPRDMFPPPKWPSITDWDDYSPESPSGLGAGDIVLIVMGVLGGLALLALVGGVVAFLIYKKRHEVSYDTI